MATSDVAICKMALSHIGQVANVVSIDPPEGSVEAEYCNAFYYTCRDAVLEAHPWNFTIGHDAALAQVTSPTLTWQYAYAMPNGADDILAVLPPQASNPYSQGIVPDSIALSYGAPTPIGGGFVPQQFELLTTSTGAIVIRNRLPLQKHRRVKILRYGNDGYIPPVGKPFSRPNHPRKRGPWRG
jgi:hypothetical protein